MAAWAGSCAAVPPTIPSCGAPSAGWPSSAPCWWPRAAATDGPCIIVPEVKDGEPTGLTLLHVRLATHLPLPALRAVLQGYRNRYGAIKHAVTETEPVFRDDLLVDVPVGRPDDRAGQRSGGTLAVVTGGVVGIGTDLVDLDRFREVLARRPTLVERLFTAGRAGVRRAARRSDRALRGALRGQGGRAEGTRRRAGSGLVARDRGRAGRRRAARRSCSRAGPPSWPPPPGVRGVAAHPHPWRRRRAGHRRRPRPCTGLGLTPLAGSVW